MAMKIVKTEYENCFECVCCGYSMNADILPPTEHLGEDIEPVWCPCCESKMKFTRRPIYTYEDDE